MKTNSILILLFVLFSYSCKTNLEDQEIIHKDSISGNAQKGPFLSGSSVTIFELDADLNQTGKVFNTQISNNAGFFTLNNLDLVSPYVLLKVDGYYFNEVKGANENSPLTLYALCDITDFSTFNVNILTYLEKDRVEYLVRNGLSLSSAKDSAQKELLRVFSINASNISHSEAMDISHDGEGNAILLAITATLQSNLPISEFSELMANFINDFKADGMINDSTIIDKIHQGASALDPQVIRQNLIDRYKEVGVTAQIPNFEDYFDSDGDGILNMYDVVIRFTPVANAKISNEFTSNSIAVKLPEGMSSALASIDRGTLIVNGVDTESKTFTVSHGDSIAIHLNSSPEYSDTVRSQLTINSNTGSFEVSTREPYGTKWTLATASAGWSARSQHTSVVFDNKIWVMGGNSNGTKNDVWYSSDGTNWTQATASANWDGRRSHASVVFDNKIWVLGGECNNGNVSKNDVWYSSDGVNWTLATDSANWSPRCGHRCEVFDNKMWVIGGSKRNFVLMYNDVWYSSDGVHWTQASNAVPPKFQFGSAVFNNRIWIFGNYGTSNEVWSSEGTDWLQASASADWTGSRTGLAGLAFDNHLWIMGGSNHNDVWYSSNGINWKMATNSADWVGRSHFPVVAFNDKIWVIGGYNSSDVWYSE